MPLWAVGTGAAEVPTVAACWEATLEEKRNHRPPRRVRAHRTRDLLSCEEPRDTISMVSMSNLVDVSAAILEVLREGDAYGLEIIARITRRTGGKLNFAQGSIYPALQNLEHAGLLLSRASTSRQPRGGRPKIYHGLTGAGFQAASERRSQVAALFLLSAPLEEPRFAEVRGGMKGQDDISAVILGR
jgi:DNA-binding PadR family transcriptional regulator